MLYYIKKSHRDYLKIGRESGYMNSKVSMIGFAKQLVKTQHSTKRKFIILGAKILSALWSLFQFSKRICTDKDYRYILLLQ